MRRFIVIVALVVLVGVGMHMAGVKLPLLDYKIGNLGGWVGGPQIQIQAPGYGVPVH